MFIRVFVIAAKHFGLLILSAGNRGKCGFGYASDSVSERLGDCAHSDTDGREDCAEAFANWVEDRCKRTCDLVSKPCF